MSRLAGHFRIALYAAIIVSVVFLYASRPSSPPHRVSNAQATTPIALLFTLSHASSSRPDLVRQLTAQVRSIMQHSKSEALLHLYLIGDDADYRLAADAIHSVVQHSPHSINLTIQVWRYFYNYTQFFKFTDNYIFANSLGKSASKTPCRCN